jgi:subtilisin
MKFFAALVVALVAVLPVEAAQTKRYIVAFEPRARISDRNRAIAHLGGKQVDAIDDLGALVVEVPVQPFSIMEQKIMAEPGVTDVEEDVYVNWLQDFGAATVPAFQGKTAVSAASLPPGVLPAETPWGVVRVNAPNAWAKTQGQGVRVAVLDTGIDGNHPDLKGQVVGCYNAFDKNASCMDDNHHGTHVAGTIAAKWDGQGVVGVAPKASLVAVKVLDKDGGANLTSVIKGILWTANNNIQVANMSLGSPIGIIFMRLAINYATSKGVVFVAAAGNNGKKVEYPGGYPNVIAVAASDEKDKIASFSSRGDKVEFIAPGVDVKSSVPGGGFEWLDGTSMATPHMAGLAALAVSRGYRGLDAVRAALTRAAKPLPGLQKAEQGRGLVDAAVLVK